MEVKTEIKRTFLIVNQKEDERIECRGKSRSEKSTQCRVRVSVCVRFQMTQGRVNKEQI